MRRWRDGVFAVAFTAGLAVAGGCAPAAAQELAAPPCGGMDITRGTASRVIDGDSFALDDDREVRLAAVEVPPPGTSAPGGAEARATLDALIGGDTVALRKAEFAADRYGRLLAYVYAVRDGEEIFAQGELLASGFARVGDRVGSRACATYLLGRESAARRDKLGLWGNSYYQVLDAETPRGCAGATRPVCAGRGPGSFRA